MKQHLPKGQQALIIKAIERTLKPSAEPLNEYDSFDLNVLKALMDQRNDVTIHLPKDVIDNFTALHGVDYPNFDIPPSADNDDSSLFRSKAIAFGLSTPKAYELWEDYTEGCYTVDYDLYLRSLKDVVELMQETFDSAVYDSGHDCIRIERPNGYDQAIYIRWDDYKKRLVVDYHHGTDETDWNGNEDSLFHPMWDEFIYNNPITEFKTITDYHRQLFDRICYVVDLHISLFCYRKVTKVTTDGMDKVIDKVLEDMDNKDWVDPNMSLKVSGHVVDLPWGPYVYDGLNFLIQKVREENV